MRRFWLLLMMFVLPLQMSWAAVHFCDQESTAKVQVTSSPVEPFAELSDKQPGESSEVQADACCCATSTCHGLHNIASHPAPGWRFNATNLLHLGPDKRLAAREFGARHERPQWSAA